jgi:hypothetical protein
VPRVIEYDRPDDVAIAPHHGVRAAKAVCLVRVQAGMNPTEDHGCASSACGGADLVAPKRIAGMNADADDIARLDGVDVERHQGFVGDPGPAT